MSSSVQKKLQRFDQLVKDIKTNTPAEVGESTHNRKERVTYLLNHWPQALKYYFPRLAKSEFAPFHIRGGDAVITFERKKMLLAWKIARDMAKTTFWQMFSIYLNLRKMHNMRKGFDTGVWMSNTWDAANKSLSLIRAHYEGNQRLINDFGEFKSTAKWSDDFFQTRQGFSWVPIGKGQNPRGLKVEDLRPNIQIWDDFDEDEECLNIHRLEKSWKWLMGALWPTQDIDDESLIAALNNGIGINSLMNGVEEKLIPGVYKQANYKETINLIGEDGKPTWDRYSLEDCNFMMTTMGTIMAEREYQNNPTVQGDVFKNEWMKDKKIELSDYVALVAYLDPSFSAKKNADHKAWLLLGLTRDGEVHIVKAFCAGATVDEMIGWGYDIQKYVKDRNQVCQLWMEDVFLQKLLYKDFAEYAKKEKLIPLPVCGDERQKPDKDQRIAATQGYFQRGQVYFNEAEKENHHMINLKFQFTSFKMGHTGIKKDGPDAFEGGLTKLLEQWQVSHPTSHGQRPKPRNMY